MRMDQGKANKQHLSMLRSYTAADFFTLANASCGTISIFLCLNYIAEGMNRYFWIAFVLLFLALAFDVMDGYWARRSKPSIERKTVTDEALRIPTHLASVQSMR